MAVEITTVGYGRPAADALRRAIDAAKAGDPLAPVTVVVPSNHVGVGTRRLLASGRLGPVCDRGTGVAAVTFLTVYRLAELLGSSSLAGAGRRPVSTPVIAAALRRSLTDRPGLFAPVAAHAATETALIAAYRELRDVEESGLDTLARRSARAADVVRLHRATRAHLVPDWYDEEDLIDAALATVGSDRRAVDGLGAVVAFLPDRLSRHGAALLQAVGDAGTLRVIAGRTGDEEADAEVQRSLRRLGVPDHPRAAAAATAAPTAPADRTRIVTVSDSDEEVRAAVRAVVDAARAGTPFDRMAILHASPIPYARLAHEQLAAAGIAVNGTAVLPLTARVTGRTLLHLLQLPDSGFRRDDVFAWLTGARLRRDGGAVPVTAWERLSRRAGVVSGRADWDLRLTLVADDSDGEADRIAADDPDAPAWRVESLRTEAARARDLRRFVLALIDDLAEAAGRPRSWSDWAGWARRHLDSLTGGERRRGSWPVAEQKGAERVERALDRLAGLDAVESGVSLDVFTRTITLELESDLGRVGRMGEGVLVGSVAMGVGLDLDLVVVLGLAEGLFPATVGDDSLLPDHERRTVDDLPLRADQTGRQHRQLLAALAGAGRHVLCVPRGDLRRNTAHVASRWVLDQAGALAGTRWWSDDLMAGTAPWLEHVASFDAGLRTASPASAQEHRLRALMAHGSTRLPADVFTAVGDAVLDGGAVVMAARRSDSFTRFDGNLTGLAVPSPAERTTSATRLERWADCPFAYLVQSVLGVDDLENPEDQLQISPRDWGSLVHESLELFIVDVLARPPESRPAPGEAWSPVDRARLLEIGGEVCARFQARGLTGRPVFWRRDKRRILADLERFLVVDSLHRAVHRTRPVAAELAFGMSRGALGTVSIDIPDGRSVQFRGLADRVDEADDGTLHVVDYKTGSARAYSGLSEENPDAGGQRLQLTVYGQAARLLRQAPHAPVLAEYWFVSAKGRFERKGYAVTPDVVAHVGRTIGTMVNGIEAGVFPHHPTATASTPFVVCPFCDPDALGVTDLARQFESKSSDPAMAVFVDLVQAEDDDSDTDDNADNGAGARV